MVKRVPRRLCGQSTQDPEEGSTSSSSSDRATLSGAPIPLSSTPEGVGFSSSEMARWSRDTNTSKPRGANGVYSVMGMCPTYVPWHHRSDPSVHSPAKQDILASPSQPPPSRGDSTAIELRTTSSARGQLEHQTDGASPQGASAACGTAGRKERWSTCHRGLPL